MIRQKRARHRFATVPLVVLAVACQSERAPHVGPVADGVQIAKLRLDKVP